MDTDVLIAFGEYVDRAIFSEERKGEIVSFLIDETFVIDFCKKNNITKENFLNAMHKGYLNAYNSNNILRIKGLLAIQLYAATRRENSDGITVANYRERLHEVLELSLIEIDRWMRSYQESCWKKLYDWCDKNCFYITKCYPKQGAGRYVQYPILQAKRLFTSEDFKYIAYNFVNNELYPEEDLSYTEFWKVITNFYDLNPHSHEIITVYGKDAYDQIYNFYLRWNGSYIIPGTQKQNDSQSTLNESFLFFSEEDMKIDIRNKNFKLSESIPVDNLSYNLIFRSYNFKRKDIILFKREGTYDGYWEEARYLESDEEGILICFNSIETRFKFSYGNKILCSNKYVTIYKIANNICTTQFYVSRRFFRLNGGLKIGRLKYLIGSPPFIHIDTDAQYLIDGQLYSYKAGDPDIFLDFLKEGKHYIKFKKHKRIEFEISNPPNKKPLRTNFYANWHLDKKTPVWQPESLNNGIVGLDFSNIYGTYNQKRKPILTRWANLHIMNISDKNEKNSALILLQNLNK